MRTPHFALLLTHKNFLLVCACLFLTGTHTLLRAQQTPPVGPEELTRGVDLYKRGEYNDTVKLLRELTKKQKDNADAWHYLGLALMKQDKVKDAGKSFEKAVTLRPQFVAAIVGLAYSSFLLNKIPEATRAVGSALKIEPQNVEARYIAGLISVRSNSFTGALDEAEAVLKRNPHHAPSLYLKAYALLAMSANAINTASDETADVRAVLVGKTKERLDEAAAALDRWQKLEPNNPKIVEMREELQTLQLYQEGFDKAPGTPGILSPRDVTQKATLLSRPEPEYTERARQNSVTGEVVLRVVLAWNGTVQNILPVKRLPDGLTEAAIRAVRKIKFKPALKDGRPVSQYVTVVYNFDIY